MRGRVRRRATARTMAAAISAAVVSGVLTMAGPATANPTAPPQPSEHAPTHERDLLTTTTDGADVLAARPELVDDVAVRNDISTTKARRLLADDAVKR